MKREYRYTVYVLALAVMITAATGIIIASGAEHADETTVESIDDIDVELTDDTDALTAEQADQLPELVWDDDAVRTYFDEPDALAFDVSPRMTYDEDAGEAVPSNETVLVDVSPPDERLPYAFVTVELDTESTTVQEGYHALDADAEFNGDRLTEAERERIVSAVFDDPDLEWDLTTLIGPDTLSVETTDRTDERVTVEFTDANTTDDEPAVRATVDLETETVTRHSVVGAVDAGQTFSIQVTEIDGDSGTFTATETETAAVTAADGAGDIEFNVTEGSVSSEPSETTVDVGEMTVSIEDRDDALESDHKAFAELVLADETVSSAVGDRESVEIDVSQDREYDEDADAFVPTETVTATITPTDDRLPSVTAVVDPDAETVTVEQNLPDLEAVEIDLADEDDLLTDGDRDRIESLAVDDDDAAYTIQNEFDEPAELEGSVSQAMTFDSDDGEFVEDDNVVRVEFAPPNVDDSTVTLRIDLAEETVLQSSVTLTLTESDVDIEVQEVEESSIDVD